MFGEKEHFSLHFLQFKKKNYICFKISWMLAGSFIQGFVDFTFTFSILAQNT